MLKKTSFIFGGDKWLLILPLSLSVFGLLSILNASSVVALRDFGDQFYYFKHQAVWLGLGIVFFFLFSFLPFHWLKKLALPALILSFFLLLLVLIPGFSKMVYGGRRWLSFGSIGFQPAEFAKLGLVVYLSSWLERKKGLLPFLSLVGIFLILLLLEPDLGTAFIIVSVAVSLFFIAGASFPHLLCLGLSLLMSAPLIILTSPYRKKRLLTFLNSSFDIQGASYHVRQVLIALTSGGFWGRGLGQSKQKFFFLPEVTTDSIFAVIAEELGFVGGLVLILVFLFLFYRLIRLACLVKDPFQRLLVSGIAVIFVVQSLINLGAIVAIIPFTGVPLPFVSYGGSSLVVFLAGMGMVYGISKKDRQ